LCAGLEKVICVLPNNIQKVITSVRKAVCADVKKCNSSEHAGQKLKLRGLQISRTGGSNVYVSFEDVTTQMFTAHGGGSVESKNVEDMNTPQ